MPSKNEVYPYLSEVLMSTFRLDDLLEELMEFRKAVILTLIVYYRQMLQIKISKRKKAQRAESRRQVSSCPLPIESHEQNLIVPAMVDDSIYKLLPAKEVQLSLGVQRFC